jgi:hypothetical protein
LQKIDKNKLKKHKKVVNLKCTRRQENLQNVKIHELCPSLHMIRMFKSRVNLAGNVTRMAVDNGILRVCIKPKVGRQSARPRYR